MFVKCRLVLPRFRRFFMKLPSTECMSILLKFRGCFAKIDIHKVQGIFTKLLSIDCGLTLPKFKVFFAKFTSRLFLVVGSADRAVHVFSTARLFEKIYPTKIITFDLPTTKDKVISGRFS